MIKRITITGDQAVAALKNLGTASCAATIAGYLTMTLGGFVDSRAVATALRGPVDDGRVTLTWRRKAGRASYRFVRLKAKVAPRG